MSAVQALLALRLLELAVLVGALWWVIFYFPPSRSKDIRLMLGCTVTAINFAAIFISIGYLKGLPW